ncbi:MAG: hypothetical protein A3F18_06805 [Legionellales bacterium RIFCSPHIGHO2_12_FULL_37_14]|nr:MAG: hypothetical protein A3F18_06805 [Legionellales bacterium RIFCSPHIGHO2_12_FULL_37_14]
MRYLNYIVGVILLIWKIDVLADDKVNDVKDANKQNSILRVTNQCDETIWVQQDFIHHTSDPIVVEIKKNYFYDYNIPAAGLAATRFWAKTGCASNGYSCKLGESTAVDCKAGAKDCEIGESFNGPFAPDVNSKFEASWGCRLPPQDGNCAKNPSDPSHQLDATTWWDASVVDGYTLPYQVVVKNDNGTCIGNDDKPIKNPGVDCKDLDVENCPTDVNLSSDGAFKEVNHISLTSVNLKWIDPETNKVAGCFSPCAKLTLSQGSENGNASGGWAMRLASDSNTPITPESDLAKWYCCPTPPISSEQCRQGPASRNAYRDAILRQHCNSYTYAYDDDYGLVQCNAHTQFEVIFCPKQGLPTPSNGNDDNPNPPNPAPKGFLFHVNYNPSYVEIAQLNGVVINNAQDLYSGVFPVQTVLKAKQKDKEIWGSCDLTFSKDNIVKGSGELCNRINHVVADGKIDLYLPAEIPNNSTPDNPPPPPVNESKNIIFNMGKDESVNFVNKTLENGGSINVEDVTIGRNETLVAMQGNNKAECVLVKTTNSLQAVQDGGYLCDKGLLISKLSTGDYSIEIPNPLPIPPNTKTVFLGIAAGTTITINGKTVRADSPEADKYVTLNAGDTNILITGSDKKTTRICKVTLNNSNLTWQADPGCAGFVLNGDVLSFPFF